MPNKITLRDVPDDIYEKLLKQAALNQRSLENEVITCLKQSLEADRKTPDQIIARAKQIRLQAKGSLNLQEIREAITQDRP
ncbi:MAG: DNA-binding protein [Candidatus Cyclonatronum sp.]|uniref:FitA-like ribbon-helix-helix domain-containing protein n=1 Tax=Cyclonatronum sp. TaxID=3024185 RepID=UPI0025BFA0CB|nr:hypothetical protein [Cyclonatronum sp.]MCH8487992.1 DNA-binding protein [Cyclonatronum sp.]